MNKLSLEDVRDYLFESNAIEEAESVILKNLLTNKPHHQSTSTPTDSSVTSKQKDVSGLHTVKISDLLGDYEKSGASKTKNNYDKQMSEYKTAEIKSIGEERKMKADSLYEFEKVAEMELQELEKRRLLMEAKLIEKKKDMEKYDIIQNIKNNTNNISSFRPSEPNLKTSNSNAISDQNQRQLNELAHQHAMRVAENKMKILEAQHELELLNTGKYVFTAPTVATSASASSPRGAAAPVASVSDDLYQKARVNQILSGLQSESEVSAHTQRIEALRSNAAKEANAVKSEPLFVNPIPNSPTKPSLSSAQMSDSKVSRDMTVNQYLDLWLERESGPTGDHLVPPPLPGMNGSGSAALLSGPQSGGSGDSTVQSGNRGRTNNSNPLMNNALQSLGGSGGQNKQLQEPQSNATNPNTSTNQTESVDAMIQRLQNENKALRAEKVELLQRDITGRPQVNNNNSSPPQRNSNNSSQMSDIDSFRNHAPMYSNQNHHHQQQQQQPQYNNNGYQQPNNNNYNPYAQGPSGPAPGFNPYHQNSNNPYQPQQQPFYQPLPMQQQPQAVQQDPMIAQMQRLTEQIERENAKLMGQLNNPNQGGSDLSPFGDIHQALPLDQLQPLPGGNKAQPMYMLERDRVGKSRVQQNNNNNISAFNNNESNSQANSTPQLSPEDQRYQSELKAIQHEIEKLRRTAELEEMRADFQRAQVTRGKDSEHADWLEAQRHELQAVKMKQVLAKEQRLLKLQLDGGELTPGGDSKPVDSSASATPIEPQKHNNLLEDCGVGSVPLPLDLSKGVSVLIDGLLLAPKSHVGNSFRAVIGIYDKSGKIVVRTHSTEWQHWEGSASQTDVMSAQFSTANGMRTLKQQGDTTLLGSKVLLEIQTRVEGGTSTKPLGWAILNLTLTPSVLIGGETTLANHAWRGVLRSGITDPLCDPLSAVSDFVENAFVLLRVIESGEASRATSWSLKEYPELVSDTDALLHFYKDPLDMPVKPSDINAKPPGSAAKVPVTSRSTKVVASDLVPQTPPRPSSSVLDNIINTSRKISTPQKSGTPLPSARPPSSTARPLTTNPSNTSLKPPLEQLPEGDENANTANNSVKIRSLDDKLYWYLGAPTGPATERYQRGDGVDIYIDGAMFLPDSVTFTRLFITLFAPNRDKIGAPYEYSALASSPATSPLFKEKIELRNNNMDVAMTALVRFDTFDYNTCLPVGVGYACFKVFSTRDRAQPKSGADPSTVYINSGSFQLPVYAGRVPGKTDIPEFDEFMLRTQPKIPCASLLIRICAAPKSADGISTLSKSEFPRDDWARLGLNIPPPAYVSGAYNGSLCEPTSSELVCFAAKSSNVIESVETALTQAMSAKGPDNGRAPRPAKHANPVEDEKNVSAWLGGLFAGITINRVLDFSMCVPYVMDSGVHVCVDSLYNLPEGTMFNSSANLLYKVICSLTPPGLYYKDPSLCDGVFYTKEHNLTAHFRAPSFRPLVTDVPPSQSTSSGGSAPPPPAASASAQKKAPQAPLTREIPFLFTPPAMSPNLCLLLDIRTIRVESSKNAALAPAIFVEPPVGRKCYWTMLPLCRERIPGQGGNYCQTGLFQLPIFEGAVPYKDLFKGSGNPYTELVARLKSKNKANSIRVLEGASIIVNIYNPALAALQTPVLLKQEPSIQYYYMNDLLEAAEAGLSGAAARSDKFTFDATKYPMGTKENKVKTTQQTLPLPKTANEEVWSDLMKNVNKAFEVATNINA